MANTSSSDATPSNPKRQRLSVMKHFYHEHPEVTNYNAYRVAETRLQTNECIFLTRGFDDKKRNCTAILNPALTIDCAFYKIPKIKRTLRRLKIHRPTRVQSQTWPLLLDGQDVIIVGQRNSVKNNYLDFLVPSFVHVNQQPEALLEYKGPRAIFLSPSADLVSQIHNQIKEFDAGIECVCDQDSWLNKNPIIICTTPGELSNLRNEVETNVISFVVLEEPDKMLNFESEIQEFLRKINVARQVVITSAMWNENVEKFSSGVCKNPIKLRIDSLTGLNNVTQHILVIKDEFEEKIVKFRNYVECPEADTKIVILCDNESSIEEVCAVLKTLNREFVCIYGDENETTRLSAVNEFANSDKNVLVARSEGTLNQELSGLNGLRCVLYFDFPKTIVDYVDQMKLFAVKNPCLKFVSILGLGDSTIVPELIAILQCLKQVVPTKLYDLANLFCRFEYSEKAPFWNIINSGCFIDKSMIIKAVIDVAENVLLIAPRGMGKSTNLQLIREFFDVARASEQKKDTFRKLLIGKQTTCVDTHYGKYAVLWMDLSKHGKSCIPDAPTCLKALCSVINDAYESYQCLWLDLKETHHTNKEMIKWFGEKESRFQNWCNNSDHMKDSDAVKAVAELAEFLSLYYDKPVILLVDEWDSLCSKTVSSKATELNAIINQYFAVFSYIMITDIGRKDFLYKAILTGVTAITSYDPSPLNNVPLAGFLDGSTFDPFYGILQAEYETMLEKFAFEKLRAEKTAALQLYNGYKSETTGNLLSTYSIIRYFSLASAPVEIRLRGHWCRTGSIEQFDGVWLNDKLRNVLETLIAGGNHTVVELQSISAIHLSKIFELCDKKNFLISDADVLFMYLKQLGYLAVVKCENRDVSLAIPNSEIRGEFTDILIKTVAEKYSVDFKFFRECAESFDRLYKNGGSLDDELKEDLEGKLSNLCKDVPEVNDVLALNEDTVEHLIYASLYKSSFSAFSQQRVPKKGEANRSKWKRLDICFYRESFGVVVEVKFGESSAEKALLQIENKRYFDIFNKPGLEKVTTKLCLGIHINREGKAEVKSTSDITSYAVES